MGLYHHGVPEALALWLKQAAGINTFVETGTNKGGTARWASRFFPSVITMEGAPGLYDAVANAPGRPAHMKCLLGDSRELLPTVLSDLSGPAMCWLDAHWCGPETFGQANECPVLPEINAVNASPLDHIILVDDARLFLGPPPAPHRASDWPDIATLVTALLDSPHERYIVVHRDVIVAAPKRLQEQMVDFVRNDTVKPNG